MKKIYSLLCLICFFSATSQVVDFDTSLQFKRAITSSTAVIGTTYGINGEHIRVDINNDGQIQLTEALLVYKIDIDSNYSMYGTTGLQSFTNLVTFNCSDTSISSINLQGLPNLENVRLDGNSFTSVTVLGITSLKNLIVTQTFIPAIDVSGLTALEHLDISHNRIFNTINLTGLSNLLTFDGSYNGIATMVFTGATSLERIILLQNRLTTIDLSGLETSLTELNILQNSIPDLNLNGFSNLRILSCGNNGISQLDIQPLTSLEYLYCDDNQIAVLNPQGLDHIIQISAGHNRLTSINVQGISTLYNLNITNNNIAGTVDIHGLPALRYFYASQNRITSLNSTDLPSLEYFTIDNNLLTEVNIAGMANLSYLICNNNTITSINAENSTHLSQINCMFNQITSLYIKNGGYETVQFDNNPNLNFICADDFQIESIGYQISQLGLTNVDLNSYCNDITTPSNRVEGTVRFFESAYDVDNTEGMLVENAEVHVRATNNGTFTNDQGFYSYTIYNRDSGSIYPAFENPELFYAPVTQYDFTYNSGEVLTKNIRFWPLSTNVNPDLDVVLIPVNHAKPGEDAKYRLLLRNKGTAAASGSLTLTYDDSVTDFVSSTTTLTSQQTGELTWEFSDLKPFNAIEANLVLHLNTPTDTPALDAGYVLNFTAVATLAQNTDYIISDNTFNLHQTVVSPYDPNDKACLEGNIIPTVQVGEYVHYIIRFENTGTANADKVTIADQIDMSKFDYATFVPLSASHPYTTMRKNLNEIAFIFNDINLPFDDENNDGFIAFKIKTLQTLTEGDTFSNYARIYFDYNRPIVTNTATTSIGVLGIKDFVFTKNFTLYPNPVINLLHIKANNSTTINSISIYNLLGQIVMAAPDTGNLTVTDVSALAKGTYIIKIYSDKGIAASKFIKD